MAGNSGGHLAAASNTLFNQPECIDTIYFCVYSIKESAKKAVSHSASHLAVVMCACAVSHSHKSSPHHLPV